jgi:hypothetical protein
MMWCRRRGPGRPRRACCGTAWAWTRARFDSTAARLLSPDTGDLAQVGGALAAGEVHPGHADVAVRVHTQLGAGVRGRVDPSTGQVCLDVVDGVLAAQARAASVAELDRFGRRLVEQLNPVSPNGAHQRRYLYLSPLPDGSLLGKFACGPAQAALLRAAVTAGAAPRPGVGIDADGVRHDLPDERTAAQRRMDALTEIITAGLARGGITLPDTLPDTLDSVATDQPAEAAADEGLAADPPEHADLGQSVGADVGADVGDLHEPPEPEGQEQVLRRPGVVTGPSPDVEIIVVATLDHLAAVAAVAVNQPIDPSAGKLFDLDPPPAGPSRRSQPDQLQSLREPGGPPGHAHDGDGEAVHPDTLRLLACSAALRRVLLTPSGAVLDLGRSVRLATPRPTPGAARPGRRLCHPRLPGARRLLRRPPRRLLDRSGPDRPGQPRAAVLPPPHRDPRAGRMADRDHRWRSLDPAAGLDRPPATTPAQHRPPNGRMTGPSPSNRSGSALSGRSGSARSGPPGGPSAAPSWRDPARATRTS